MGGVKQHQIEVEGRGFNDISERFVCSDCFEDYALKEFIETNADNKECSYCNRTSNDDIAVA